MLRTLRKEEGPARYLQSSYGVLRSEPYMDHKEAHEQQQPWRDPVDGKNYVETTVRWLIHKVPDARVGMET